MDNWKTVTYNGDSQTGPAEAIDLVVKDLEKAGTEYEVFDFVMEEAPKATRKKKVADKELEVR